MGRGGGGKKKQTPARSPLPPSSEESEMTPAAAPPLSASAKALEFERRFQQLIQGTIIESDDEKRSEASKLLETVKEWLIEGEGETHLHVSTSLSNTFLQQLASYIPPFILPKLVNLFNINEELNQRVGALEAELETTKQQLEDTTAELAETKKQLAEMKKKLEKEIEDLRNQLMGTNNQLKERNTDRDTLLLGQLGFVYERLFIDTLGVPQEVGIIDTIKELEDLLGEDWTEYGVSEEVQQRVRDNFDQARKEYLTPGARAAIRTLKHHRIETAHPPIDLDDDDTLKRLYAAIDSAGTRNPQAIRALVANAQRLQTSLLDTA